MIFLHMLFTFFASYKARKSSSNYGQKEALKKPHIAFHKCQKMHANSSSFFVSISRSTARPKRRCPTDSNLGFDKNKKKPQQRHKAAAGLLPLSFLSGLHVAFFQSLENCMAASYHYI